MQDLLDIMTELHPDVDFEKETDLINRRVIDSFDIVSIIAEVDDVFGVTIPAEEILPENFYSAETLYALIERLIEQDA